MLLWLVLAVIIWTTGTHKVVLQSLYMWLLSSIITRHGVFLEHIHHDFMVVDRGLACRSSNQAPGLDYLGRDHRCNHISSFLSATCSDLTSWYDCLIGRGLGQHVWERQIVRAFQRHRVHSVILVLMIVSWTGDSRQEIVSIPWLWRIHLLLWWRWTLDK